MTTVNLNNTQSASSSENSLGIVGSTSSLIAQLIESYTKLSIINSALNVVDTRAQRSIGQKQAESITNAAKEKANSMRCQAIGGFVSGGLEIAGGVASGLMGHFGNNASEIENIGKYQNEVNNALANPPDETLSTLNDADQAAETRKAKTRMNELSSTQDFKDQNIEEDKDAIHTAEEPELQSLKKHLDDLSIQKKQGQMSDKHQGLIMAITRGSGAIGKGIADDVAASHNTKAGYAEADSSLEQTAVSMMGNGAQEANKTAAKYAELASQIIETLVQVGEADVFRG